MAQSQQQPPTMDADTMLDVYILDYLIKKNYGNSTKAFEGEAKVPANVHAIDAPRGFLFEWWTVFWDTFISRYKRNQGSMEPSNEVIRVPHQQQGSQSFNPNNVNTGKSPWSGETSALMKQPVPKQWYGDNAALIMNHINSMNQLPIEHQKQALVPRHDMNGLTNSMINPSAQIIPTGGIPTMPLRGWPLTQQGLEQIQTRFQRQNEGQIQPSNSNDRKRKQPMTSMLVPNTSNSIQMFSSNSREVSKPNSPQNEKINVDDFIDYGAFDGNENNSLLLNADKEPQVNTSNGFTFLEVGSVEATSVNCCHISHDGKLVAVGGQDKKARLWCTSTRENTATLDAHSQALTDIRFSPSMPLLATCSQDKTIRIWDLENLSGPIRTFTGHTASVLSIDFHPKKDCVCSCDESEIRFWTIKNAGCLKVTKGGANLVRIQSGVGKLLAAVVGKSVSLMELENPQAKKHVLKGHASNVQSICWDTSGEHLVTVSEDMVKVWRMDSGNKVNLNCVHNLSVNGKRFRCATFHPCYSSLLIIGCYQSMELWNMTENKMMMPAEEPVSALAVSSTSGLIASAGHNDNVVKIWK